MDLLSALRKFFNIPKVGNTPQNIGQCTGLVNKYVESLGLPHLWGDAKDLLTNADPTAYAITYNDPNDINQFPQSGSVISWGDTWGNGDGHTGVVIFADGKLFSTLEQNNPVGHAPQTIMHDYKGVVGWITPKNLPKTPTVEELNACMQDRNNFWKQRDELITASEELKTQLKDKTAQLTAFAALGYPTVDDVTKRAKEQDDIILGLQTQLKQVLDRNTILLDMVKKKEEEDSTAIEVGLDAQGQVKDLQHNMEKVAQVAETQPNANEIIKKFDYLKRIGEWGEKLLKKTEDDQKRTQNVTTPGQSLGSFFITIFLEGLGGGV